MNSPFLIVRGVKSLHNCMWGTQRANDYNLSMRVLPQSVKYYLMFIGSATIGDFLFTHQNIVNVGHQCTHVLVFQSSLTRCCRRRCRAGVATSIAIRAWRVTGAATTTAPTGLEIEKEVLNCFWPRRRVGLVDAVQLQLCAFFANERNI